VLALVLWSACGPSDGVDGLRKHRDPDLSFMYPATWELTHDTFELDTPDSRVLILRAPGDAVVMIHRFIPATGWTLREFAREFATQRSVRLSQQGAARPREVKTSQLSLAPRGRPLQGLRQDFELERNGVSSQQTSLFFAVPRGGVQVFVSAHAPRPMANALASDLKTVLSSIRGGSLMEDETSELGPKLEVSEGAR